MKIRSGTWRKDRMILPLGMDTPEVSLQLRLKEHLFKDDLRMSALALVEEVVGEDGWIGGGFIRNCVWDELGGIRTTPTDIDVIYLGNGEKEREDQYTSKLTTMLSTVTWEVRDQVRMAQKHGHLQYPDISSALSTWVEKCTAVAVRKHGNNLDIVAPWGLEDLFQGIISPTDPKMRPVMLERIKTKNWLSQYPFLVVES